MINKTVVTRQCPAFPVLVQRTVYVIGDDFYYGRAPNCIQHIYKNLSRVFNGILLHDKFLKVLSQLFQLAITCFIPKIYSVLNFSYKKMWQENLFATSDCI